MSLLSAYQGLPYPLRVAAASARGYYLRRNRYTGEFPRALEQVKARERWTLQQWQQWQQETLARLLHRAATQVPWYRNYWQERRRKGDNASWELLENWPVLEKEDLREHGRALVADDANFRKLHHTMTSGTTGTPTQLWISRTTQQKWYAQVEARMRLWHGVSRHDPWAHLGGKQVASIHAQEPPFWVWNQGMNQLYLSTYHLRAGRFAQYAEAMRVNRVKSLIGYSSAIYELAKGCLNEGVTGLQLKTVASEGEPVMDFYRDTVRQAFGCELQETYGMVEMAAAASQCPDGTLHIWPDTGIIETVDGDRPVSPGMSGDMLCTGLVNEDMPLIRYRNGDRGVVAHDASDCVCGRQLPELREIEGRISDLLITPDGRRLSPAYVEIIYDEQHPIAEAQLVQHALDHVTLRYVPLSGFDAHAEGQLRRSVARILGDVRLELESMNQIPRGPNGKLRAVLSQLTPEQKREALKTSPGTQK